MAELLESLIKACLPHFGNASSNESLVEKLQEFLSHAHASGASSVQSVSSSSTPSNSQPKPDEAKFKALVFFATEGLGVRPLAEGDSNDQFGQKLSDRMVELGLLSKKKILWCNPRRMVRDVSVCHSGKTTNDNSISSSVHVSHTLTMKRERAWKGLIRIIAVKPTVTPALGAWVMTHMCAIVCVHKHWFRDVKCHGTHGMMSDRLTWAEVWTLIFEPDICHFHGFHVGLACHAATFTFKELNSDADT